MCEFVYLSACRPNVSSGTSYTLPWRTGEMRKTGNVSADEHPRVIFISSRVPAAEVQSETVDVNTALTEYISK